MIESFNLAIEQLAAKLFGWLNDIILALPNLVLAFLVVIFSYFITKKLKGAVNRGLLRTKTSATAIGILTNMLVVVFTVITLFVVLNILNLSDAASALIGTAGVIGLAVGLALQDPLMNFFSGIMMSIRHYYEVGDLVQTNGYLGEIQEINLRSTVMLQPDGRQVIIPNKDVLQTALTNLSKSGKRRIEILCGVSYNDDLEKVKTVVIEAVSAIQPDIGPINNIEVFFTEFGDSSINFTLRFWQKITLQSDYMTAKDKAIIAIKKAFDKENISIPFPVTTLDFPSKNRNE